MKLKSAGPIMVAICGALASSGAEGSTLIFSVNSPGVSAYTSFADGSLSADGFFPFSNPTQALSVQNDNKIFFTAPVELISLSLSPLPITLPGGGTNTQSPTTITVLTFDSSNNQLGSQTTTQPFFGNLTFNETDVSTIEFVFNRDDGGLTASYLVSDVTYTVSAVPEPST